MAAGVAEGEDVPESTEPTLLERLRRLEGGHPASTDREAQQQPRQQPLRLASDSVTTVLGQALDSGDRQLLEKCLSVREAPAIDKTVRGLSPPQAMLLLQACVDRIQGKAARTRELAAWLRALLLNHTAYLMSAPGAHRALTTLSQVIEQRVALQRPLLALAGRLDLLTAHVARLKQGRRELQLQQQQPGQQGRGRGRQQPPGGAALPLADSDAFEPAVYDESEEERREALRGAAPNGGASAMSISGDSSSEDDDSGAEEEEEGEEGEEEGPRLAGAGLAEASDSSGDEEGEDEEGSSDEEEESESNE